MLKVVEEAQTESAAIDFKAGFDVRSPKDWCEVIKDLVAMANSGGGGIIFGVNDDGTPSGSDLSGLRNLDPATVTDKLFKYTGKQFSDFHLYETTRVGALVVVLEVGPAHIPLVFTAPGTYSVGGGKQDSAFRQWAVYFRHGAKSEAGTSDDLKLVVDREVERLRSSWLDGIRKIVEAPAGSVIQVVAPDLGPSASGATPVRLTHDPGAPALRAPDFDALYPYRQKEVLARLATLLPGVKLTTHDILCVRRHHRVDENPTYSSKHKFGSRQYSDAMVEWLVRSYRADPNFFHAAKEAYKHAPEAAGSKS